MVSHIGALLLHLLSAPDAKLADFDKAAPGAQYSQALLNKGAIEAVQHHVDAAPAGDLRNLCRKIERA